jgi:hypothetical protein
VVITAGLIGLLAANYYLRSTLEEAPKYLYSFLERFYPTQLPIIFGQLQTWQLFLPLKEITGTWSTSTLLLTYQLERTLTPAGVWYLYNALSIVVAFGTAFTLFRSAVFAFTFAIGVGFGTQFYHAYAVTGGIASYIVAVYHMLLIFTTVQIVRGVGPRAVWYGAFAVSLALNMVGYEGWLDVLVLFWVSLPFVYVGLRRLDRLAEASRFARMTGVLTAAGVLYLFIKLNWGYGQVEGSESDVIFNYASFWPMAEDLISNVFTHTYLSISNFLPPSLVGASSMYRLGAETLIDAQHGYHQPFEYLVPMHHVFFWRYYAGATFVIVLYALARACRRMWERPSAWTLALIVILLMLLVPGSTHEMIKFRPMNAMPAMTYHVTVGVLGASLLIAWLATHGWQTWRNRRAAAAMVAAVWLVLFYGALARPAYLSYMSAQAGLGNLLYPNPMQKLVEKLGGTYEAPRGRLAYQLMPYKRDEEIAAARRGLAPLPNPLPPLDQWINASAGGEVATTPKAIDMKGDTTQFGYQLMSPPIAVRPDSHYLLRVRFEVNEGRVCAGVLTGNQQRWVVPPDGATAEQAFDTGPVDQIRVVLANCFVADAGNPRSAFTLTGGSYAMLGQATP